MKRVGGWFQLVILALAVTAPAGSSAQQQGQVRLPDERAVDLAISEMLAGWQIGDVELLHKHVADDVTVVSGVWEPPLAGWASYLQAYQKQRARIDSVRMDRSNTVLTLRGNTAWAVYLWEFEARVEGRPTGARGHTTLVLEKRKDNWLIVLNHTSIVSEARPAEAQPPAPPQPAKPGK